ncbi:P1 family peptidase [Calidifontibacter terrae]
MVENNRAPLPVDLLEDRLPHGPRDTICDVDGVRVGHRTLIGDDLRTGVTAVVPDPLPTPARPLPAALAVGNGHGKFVGATQIDELGTLETPIVLTNTFATYRAADALLGWMLEQPGLEQTITLNPVVGECNDSWLSDIRARPITEADVRAALDSADDNPELGAVGAGTGTRALGFKGGIGSASRTTPDGVTVGVLAQTNFTGRLRLKDRTVEPADPTRPQGNSCVIVVATDAAVDARQLGRIARRAIFAMGVVGADYAHGSGDYAIAFTTNTTTNTLVDLQLDPLFAATIEATTAALLSSLWHAPTTVGRAGNTARGLQDELRRK